MLNGTKVRLHLITATPNDLMLQNNRYKEQIDTTSKAPERLKISE